MLLLILISLLINVFLLSLQLKIPIKIGFQSPIADDLYSVVIQPVENSFLERSYQVVEMILGMGSE